MTNFSFNSRQAPARHAPGLGVVADVMVDACFDFSKSIEEQGVVIWFHSTPSVLWATRCNGLDNHYGFTFDTSLPIGQLGEGQRELLYYGVDSERFKRHGPGAKPLSTVLKGRFEGVITNLQRRYHEGQSESGLKVKWDELFARQTCPDCGGARLRAESRQVRVNGRSIIQMTQMSLEEVETWLAELPATLDGQREGSGRPVIDDLERPYPAIGGPPGWVT
jgi:excinuclease ABC subunit A